MEGYSVTEAASILGVPTERVWELLARGILSGASDGETGMRVFLQPRPAPAPAPVEVHPQTDATRTEPERELSPFRELLTEFRNLTERYGQALLALGEARGEVAALRSRVDLLEARMDLRLPFAATPSPAMPWLGRHAAAESAQPAAPPEVRSEPRPAEPHEDAPHEDAPHEDAPHEAVAEEAELDTRGRRRRNSHRHATDVFAEALARAQDPSLRDLPGAAEAADALAALREESRVAQAEPSSEVSAERAPAPEAAEAALPRELPVADSVPVPDEPEAEVVLRETEPEPTAEPTTPPAVEAEPEPVAPATEGAQEAQQAPPAEVIEPEPRPEEAEPQPDATADVAVAEEIAAAAALQQAATAAVEPEAVAAAEPTIDVAPPPQSDAEPDASRLAPTEEPELREETELIAAEPQAGVMELGAEPTPGDEPEDETQTAEAAFSEAPIDWDRERYTTSLGEPDWYAAEELPYEDRLHEEAVPADAAPAVEEPMGAAGPSEEESAAFAAPEDEQSTAQPPTAARPEESWPTAPERAAKEEHLLWFGREPEKQEESADASVTPAEEGADEMEVAGTGTRRQPGETTRLPGTWDLDDALAALDALAGRNRGAGEGTAQQSRAATSTAPEHRSPALRAYRRLRRILPG